MGYDKVKCWILEQKTDYVAQAKKECLYVVYNGYVDGENARIVRNPDIYIHNIYIYIYICIIYISKW